MAVPPTWGYGSEGNAQAGIKGTDTLVFVVDIEGTFNSKSSAKGKNVPQNDASLPTVGTNTDGAAPKITVPKKAAPTKLVANYVIEGDGEELKADSSVLVQYEGVLWDSGKEFDSTYKRGQLTQFSLQQVVKGWAQGLTGKKVGSRVLIVIPCGSGLRRQPMRRAAVSRRTPLSSSRSTSWRRSDPSGDVRLSMLSLRTQSRSKDVSIEKPEIDFPEGQLPHGP